MFDNAAPVSAAPVMNSMPVAVADNEEKIKLETKLATLSPTDRNQLMAMKATLNPGDFGSISKYASQVNGVGDQVVNAVLQTVRADKLANVSGDINKILMTAKGINADSLRNAPDSSGVVGFLSKMFPFIWKTKEQILARFNTMAGQIDRTAKEINGAMVQCHSDIKTMEQMGRNCVQQYNMFEAMIVAGKLRHMELADEVVAEQEAYKNMPPDQVDPLKYQELQKKINYVDTLGKKISNMEQAQQVIYIQIPQLQLMVKNSTDNANEFQTILDTTIPIWKTSFTQAIMIDKQQKDAAMIKDVKDFTNDLLKKNATNLKTASIDIAKQGARGIVDVDTLQHMQSEFIQTIQSCMDTYHNSAQQRKELSGKIETMRIEFKNSLENNGAKAIAQTP